MFAKRFFYLCAGLLCLAITYHVGARMAGAQTGGTAVALDLLQQTNCYGLVAVDASGRVLTECGGTWHQVATVPGRPADVFADGQQLWVLLESGDLYHASTGNPGWSMTPVGSIFDAPTPVQKASWGKVKATYR